MAWTAAQDIVDSWIGEDIPEDLVVVDNWIGKAERLIRFRVPGIQARITALETDLLENVIDVVAAMVTRKFRNPEGIRNSQVTTGPFTESRTFGGNDPGELTLLDSELAILLGATAGTRRAFTVDSFPTSSQFSPAYTGLYPITSDLYGGADFDQIPT
jgi:hypothetical protein